MSEETTNPPHHVPLTVLPSSGKVDQLRQEVAQEGTVPRREDAHAPAAATKEGQSTSEGQPSSEGRPTDPPKQTPRQREIEIKVIGALRGIFDPEIPVNIYDLGLIYEVKVDETDAVNVKMTLTAPACPVAGSLPGEVEQKIEAIPEVRTASVELVWEPPWSKDMMSESAMLDLGFL
jgi:FeS assembly SUF system protein